MRAHFDKDKILAAYRRMQQQNRASLPSDAPPALTLQADLLELVMPQVVGYFIDQVNSGVEFGDIACAAASLMANVAMAAGQNDAVSVRSILCDCAEMLGDEQRVQSSAHKSIAAEQAGRA